MEGEHEQAVDDGSGEHVTLKQVVSLLMAVLKNTMAPAVARQALEGALKDCGLELPSLLALLPAKGKAGRAAGPKTKKRKGEENGGDDAPPSKKKEKKDRAPRKLSAMNLFMTIVFDRMHKDPNNLAYKLPRPVDEQGNEVPLRGGKMTLVSSFWAAMSEADKARFVEMMTPLQNAQNEHAGEKRADGALLQEIQAYLATNKLEKELGLILRRTIEKATGHNPDKPGPPAAAAPATSNGAKAATPAKPTPGKSALAVGNGPKEDTITKKQPAAAAPDSDKLDKKAKKAKKEAEAKAAAEKEAADKKKKEAEAKAAAEKAAAAAKAKKAASSSSSSDEDDDDEDDD